MPTINGMWKWNLLVVDTFINIASEEARWDIDFTSAGEKFDRLNLSLNAIMELSMSYNDTPVQISEMIFRDPDDPYSYENVTSFVEKYRIIDFGEGQEIELILYDFIIHNAKRLPEIAEKLITIAENQQKVYDAGYTEGYQEGLNSFVDTFCNLDNLIPILYAEYVDAQSTSTNNSESTNKHLIGPVYGLNNENERVPILYHIEYSEMGVDKYYYIGQETKEGTLYDKWRKIEPGKNFAWDSAQKIYVYTAPIIPSEES